MVEHSYVQGVDSVACTGVRTITQSVSFQDPLWPRLLRCLPVLQRPAVRAPHGAILSLPASNTMNIFVDRVLSTTAFHMKVNFLA